MKTTSAFWGNTSRPASGSERLRLGNGIHNSATDRIRRPRYRCGRPDDAKYLAVQHICYLLSPLLATSRHVDHGLVTGIPNGAPSRNRSLDCHLLRLLPCNGEHLSAMDGGAGGVLAWIDFESANLSTCTPRPRSLHMALSALADRAFSHQNVPNNGKNGRASPQAARWCPLRQCLDLVHHRRQHVLGRDGEHDTTAAASGLRLDVEAEDMNPSLMWVFSSERVIFNRSANRTEICDFRSSASDFVPCTSTTKLSA
ncbi:hypothetical protein OG563_46660 [Nocardia vinacea]|uniref:Uncharacterized protein n=1 Tax=Nocardia vinacea TaxID=96468 RepID=A0ABZ1YXG6_9NOCA|nr:hypothetical protein [Nocardia vinacea]